MKPCPRTIATMVILIAIASLSACTVFAEEKADDSSSGMAQQIAAAITESAKALNVSVDQFSESDVGRMFYWSLWWKFIGQTIWHVVVSAILLITLNLTLWHIGKRVPAILEYVDRHTSGDVEFGAALVGFVAGIGVVTVEIILIANIVMP